MSPRSDRHTLAPVSVLSKVRGRIHYLLALVVVAAIVTFGTWAIVTGERHDRACEAAGGLPRGTLCLAPEAIIDF
jgi:hypothetical protein